MGGRAANDACGAGAVTVLSGLADGAGVCSRVAEGLIEGAALAVGDIEDVERTAAVGGITVGAGAGRIMQDALTRLKIMRITNSFFITLLYDRPPLNNSLSPLSLRML